VSSDAELRQMAARRGRLALALTGGVIAAYFGFILLVAFDKPLLGTLVAPGLSLGIALGAAVIVISWLLTLVYVRWMNRHYDATLARLRR
jgi:uncharacterized membrane protein (DUF485 family)